MRNSYTTYEEPIYSGHLKDISDFGVWHLTIKDAAELVVVDMWHAGVFPDVEEPEDWDGNPYNPVLLSLLEKYIESFETQMTDSVDAGRLKAVKVGRDFGGTLLPEVTYVSYSDLTKWVKEYGYEGGDIITEWEEKEAEIAEEVCDQVAYLRASSKNVGPDATVRTILFQGVMAKAGKLDETEAADVIGAYKASVIENEHLKKEIGLLKQQIGHARLERSAEVDRPAPTSVRRTLLTIIAAICDYADIKYQARGASAQISKLTSEIGATVDADTIRKYLAKISDALETRKK